MPKGKHDNKLEFSGVNELISFMEGSSGATVQVVAQSEAERRDPSAAWIG